MDRLFRLDVPPPNGIPPITPRFRVEPGHFRVNFAHLQRQYNSENPAAAVRAIRLLTEPVKASGVFDDDDDDDSSSASGEADLGVDPLAASGNKWAAIIAKHTAFAADAGGDDDSDNEDGSVEIDSDSSAAGMT